MAFTHGTPTTPHHRQYSRRKSEARLVQTGDLLSRRCGRRAHVCVAVCLKRAAILETPAKSVPNLTTPAYGRESALEHAWQRSWNCFLAAFSWWWHIMKLRLQSTMAHLRQCRAVWKQLTFLSPGYS